MASFVSEFSPLLAQRGPRVKAAAPVSEDVGSPARVAIAMVFFAAVYGLIALRLVSLGMAKEAPATAYIGAQQAIAASRPDLLDRNGEILATDIKTASLYAEPRKIVDVEEAIDKLSGVLPELGTETLRRRLESGSAFQWLKRELTPDQRRAIHHLGLPGIGFLTESSRFYPGGPTASHIVGHVNVDNQGTAGIEKYLDGQGLGDLQSAGFATDRPLEPVTLSADLRVQHVVRDELVKAIDRYQAIAAIGIVLDAKTGEVVAMSSLPDYDPNDPAGALEADNLNRATAGVYEMGSVFKTFSVAMALDSGKVSIEDSFDATKPIRVSRYTINDFHGKHRVLSVPEVFIYSSNIGTAKMTLEAGIDHQKEFFRRIGLLSRVQTELPEVAAPMLPPKWTELAAMTISFGHGISVSPMQTAVATAALVNGGILIPPTFLERDEKTAAQLGTRVVSERVSDAMRYLFRLNAVEGSGRRARVPGYMVGGKTGTADKVVNGRYVNGKRRNSFLAAFPMDDPRYVVLVVLDEPKAAREGGGTTAGSNAAPTVASIIRRAAPMLGVAPRFGDDKDTVLISY